MYWKWIPKKICSRDLFNDADAALAAQNDAKQVEEWQKRVETVFQHSIASARRLEAFLNPENLPFMFSGDTLSDNLKRRVDTK